MKNTDQRIYAISQAADTDIRNIGNSRLLLNTAEHGEICGGVVTIDRPFVTDGKETLEFTIEAGEEPHNLVFSIEKAIQGKYQFFFSYRLLIKRSPLLYQAIKVCT